MIKGLFIFESRASFGYSNNLLKKLKNSKKFKIYTLITGTHLSKELGNSLKDLKLNKIKIDFKFKFNSKNISVGTSNLIKKVDFIINKIKPKFIFIFGDRIELMPIALTSMM